MDEKGRRGDEEERREESKLAIQHRNIHVVA